MRSDSVGAVLGAAGVALAATANEPVAIEVSEDGRLRAELPASPARAMGWRAENGTVPFGTQPDQVVQLRRQIGGLKVADLNNDGFNDVVAVCYISNSFPPYDDWRDQIYFGNGAGIEMTPSWVASTQTHSGDVQVGDINGDGVDDAVVVNGGGIRSDHVRVYLGADGPPSTNEAFVSSFAARGWGTSGVLFDIDGDEHLDFFVTNQGLDPVPFKPMTLYRNTGTGFSPAPDWISAEQSIQGGASVGDLDGDGDLDIGVSRWANFASGVIENVEGTPDETTPLFGVGSTGTDRGSSFADVDGNGFVDFAVGEDDAPTLWSNGPDGLSQTWTGTPPFNGPQDFGFFDVDGDGDADLVEIHFSDGRAHVYQNNAGQLDVAPSWTYDAPQAGTALALGDLNNDGRDDLVLGYAGDTSIRVFFAEAPPCPADLAFPFGFLDLSDVDAFIAAFLVSGTLADLAFPFGIVDLSDVDAFIGSFLAGCS